MEIRNIQKKDYRAAMRMVLSSFAACNAADYSKVAAASFARYAAYVAFARRQKNGHRTLVAYENRSVIGLLEVRLPHHITMLFVSPDCLRKGVGEELLLSALESILLDHRPPITVTVNASIYAHSFYQKMGFQDAGPMCGEDELHVTPMSLAITAQNQQLLFRSDIRAATDASNHPSPIQPLDHAHLI